MVPEQLDLDTAIDTAQGGQVLQQQHCSRTGDHTVSVVLLILSSAVGRAAAPVNVHDLHYCSHKIRHGLGLGLSPISKFTAPRLLFRTTPLHGSPNLQIVHTFYSSRQMGLQACV